MIPSPYETIYSNIQQHIYIFSFSYNKLMEIEVLKVLLKLLKCTKNSLFLFIQFQISIQNVVKSINL